MVASAQTRFGNVGIGMQKLGHSQLTLTLDPLYQTPGVESELEHTRHHPSAGLDPLQSTRPPLYL